MNSFTRHLLGLASVAMLGFQATSVMAGDLLPPPPPPPQVYAPPPMAYQPLPLRRAVYGWGGGYAGGFLGSQCTDFVATVGTTVKGTSITETQTESGCTAQGGLMAGYNIQQNEIVYGIELDYAMSGEMLKESAGWGNGGMDPLLTLRGRAGYAFGSTMPYVTAGAAFAQGDLLDDKNWHSGWVVGRIPACRFWCQNLWQHLLQWRHRAGQCEHGAPRPHLALRPDDCAAASLSRPCRRLIEERRTPLQGTRRLERSGRFTLRGDRCQY